MGQLNCHCLIYFIRIVPITPYVALDHFLQEFLI